MSGTYYDLNQKYNQLLFLVQGGGNNTASLSADQTFTGQNTFTRPISGDLSGIAKVATNATNASNLNTTQTTTGGTYYPTFVSSNTNGFYPNFTGTLTYNPSTNALTATTFTGDLSGIAKVATNATNASNLNTTQTTTSGTFYPTFVSSNTNGFYPNFTGTLSYNPSTNALTATTFTGDLSGTAKVATNATNASNLNTTQTTTSGTFYPTFVSSNTNGFYPNFTGTLSYNPSTNALTAATFAGDLSGNASTATNATNASNLNTTLTSSTNAFYPTFVSSNTNGFYPNFVGSLTYTPSTNALTATTFIGALSGTATNSNNVLLTTDNTAGSYYIPFSKTSVGATPANKPLYIDDTTTPLTYNPFGSTLTATNFAGNATTATTGTNVSTTQNGTMTGYGFCLVPNNGTTASQGINTAQYLTLLSSTSAQNTLSSTSTATRIQIPATTGTFDIYNGSSSVLSVGTTGFVIIPNLTASTTFLLPTGNSTATFSASSLTITGNSSKSFNNFNISIGGTANFINTLTLSAISTNSVVYCSIYNAGTGNLSIASSGLGTGIKTTYTSAVVVPTLGTALMTIQYFNFTTPIGVQYIVSVSLVA
jgi:hypothetical protein